MRISATPNDDNLPLRWARFEWSKTQIIELIKSKLTNKRVVECWLVVYKDPTCRRVLNRRLLYYPRSGHNGMSNTLLFNGTEYRLEWLPDHDIPYPGQP